MIRAEPRASGTWYELVHDRLLGPVRESNAAAAARRRRRQLRIAAAALVAALVVAFVSIILAAGGAGEGDAPGSVPASSVREIVPKRFRFDKVPVNTEASQTFTLIGVHGQLSTIQSFRPLSTPNFQASSDCAYGAYRASCEIPVIFTPTERREYVQRFAIIYTIQDEPDQHPHTDSFTVSGTGT